FAIGPRESGHTIDHVAHDAALGIEQIDDLHQIALHPGGRLWSKPSSSFSSIMLQNLTQSCLADDRVIGRGPVAVSAADAAVASVNVSLCPLWSAFIACRSPL